MTYVTGFFLVFAGMLIGYFLWYRDRTEEEQRRLTLERETEEMRASLKMAHNAHAVLDERYIRQKGQLNVLQQLCDDWSSSREQTERDRAQLEVEVEDKRKKFDEAASELKKEKQQRIELEDQLHQLNQQHIEILNQVEQDWREKHHEFESSLNQRQSELKSAVEENERLTKSLHQSEAMVAELQSEIDANQTLLETATKNASGLEQEYVSLESSLRESSDLLKKSRSECATAVSERKVAEESLVALQNQHEQLQQHIEKLRSELSSKGALEIQLESLGKSLENTQEQLQKVSRQRDLSLKAEETAVSISTGLQHRIDNQESTIHRLREKHTDAMESLKQELQTRTELESHLEKQKEDLEARISEQKKQLELHATEMKSKFGQMQSDLSQEISDKSAQIEAMGQHRDALSASLDQANERLADAAARIAQLESESATLELQCNQLRSKSERMEQFETRLNERQSQFDTQSAELKSTAAELGDYKQVVSQKDEQIVGLNDEITKIRIELAATGQRVFELEANADLKQAQIEQLDAAKSNYDTEIGSIRAKLRASEDTIRTLRKERAGVLARLANYRTVTEPDATVISFTQAMEHKKRGVFDQEYRGHTRLDDRRGIIYTSPPESRDDLKRISGIAEVLEARLNDYGIYTFKQIMDWKPEAIEEFSRLLAFRERIERDDWKGQAKFFYEQKKSQAAA